MSADADPSSGYIIYDTSTSQDGWTALGGTSGATPLWAAVLAVVASANGNTAGYGALNPALYLLAQQSPGTYLNDVTSGNNDYNATDGGQYPAMSGYDMATGLGTPVASELAAGLIAIPLDVAVSGSQTYGGSPTFTASPTSTGRERCPTGVTLNTSGLSCTTVGTSTTIGPTSRRADTPLWGPRAAAEPHRAGRGRLLPRLHQGRQRLHRRPDPGRCRGLGHADLRRHAEVHRDGQPATGRHRGHVGTQLHPDRNRDDRTHHARGELHAGAVSCSGATLSGTNATNYGVVYTSTAGGFTVTPAPIAVAVSGARPTADRRRSSAPTPRPLA